MKTILVFGNEDLAEDSLAQEIAGELEGCGVKFIRCRVPDEILDYIERKDVFIMDVVKGIKGATIIGNVKELRDPKPFSMHDFDLGSFLKLLDACGKAGNIRIIGIPQHGDKESIKSQLMKILNL